MSRMIKMRMMSKFLTNRGRGRPDPRAEPRHGVKNMLIMLMLIIISSMSPSVDLSKNR